MLQKAQRWALAHIIKRLSHSNIFKQKHAAPELLARHRLQRRPIQLQFEMTVTYQQCSYIVSNARMQ